MMKNNPISKEKIFEELFSRYPQLDVCRQSVWDAFRLMEQSYRNSGSLYIAGNGGSAADSGHIAGELMKSFLFKRQLDQSEVQKYTERFAQEGQRLAEQLEKGLPAFSLPSFCALSTAVLNDVGGEYVFAQALNAAARKGDVFLGISTSGNSINIVHAMMTAKVRELSCIGMTGENSCRLDGICDVVIHVPQVETYKIQELHLPVYHALCAMLEAEFFGRKESQREKQCT